MNFYMSDFKHKIYGLYTGKYGTVLINMTLPDALSHLVGRGSPCLPLHHLPVGQRDLDWCRIFGSDAVCVFLLETFPHRQTMRDVVW